MDGIIHWQASQITSESSNYLEQQATPERSQRPPQTHTEAPSSSPSPHAYKYCASSPWTPPASIIRAIKHHRSRPQSLMNIPSWAGPPQTGAEGSVKYAPKPSGLLLRTLNRENTSKAGVQKSIPYTNTKFRLRPYPSTRSKDRVAGNTGMSRNSSKSRHCSIPSDQPRPSSIIIQDHSMGPPSKDILSTQVGTMRVDLLPQASSSLITSETAEPERPTKNQPSGKVQRKSLQAPSNTADNTPHDGMLERTPLTPQTPVIGRRNILPAHNTAIQSQLYPTPSQTVRRDPPALGMRTNTFTPYSRKAAIHSAHVLANCNDFLSRCSLDDEQNVTRSRSSSCSADTSLGSYQQLDTRHTSSPIVNSPPNPSRIPRKCASHLDSTIGPLSPMERKMRTPPTSPQKKRIRPASSTARTTDSIRRPITMSSIHTNDAQDSLISKGKAQALALKMDEYFPAIPSKSLCSPEPANGTGHAPESDGVDAELSFTYDPDQLEAVLKQLDD